jgi:DNA-binding LacI/PurR family transcriptional regulator
VNVEIAELGRRAFELLLDVVDGNTTSPRREKFPTRLVVRESCGSQLRVPTHPQLSIHRGGGKA